MAIGRSMLLPLLTGLALPALAGAQALRGTVSDSTSRRPIPGAVVTVLDSAGGLLARGITNERGAFAVAWLPRSQRLRVVRIGFRPRDVALDPSSAGASPMAVAMLSLPMLIEAARVESKQCPRRSDAALASGLWEQARAGLLATIVARETNQAAMHRIGFERMMRGTGEDISFQVITTDSAERTERAYRAARPAGDFITRGFSGDSSGHTIYFAPDADLLLDGQFANGYCFRLVSPPRSRAGQVGLGFSAPDRRPGRVDIDGALWVDTARRSLVEIDYRYVRTTPNVDDLRPGGTISFREMPNGVSFIDRWHIRMIGAMVDSIWRAGVAPVAANAFFAAQSGGEVSHARWPDGTTFDASLGRLLLDARTLHGTPAAGRTVKLADTPYGRILDATGTFEVRDLVPGPYRVVVPEPRLAELRLDSIPTTVSFVAVRDSTHRATVSVPTLEEWIVQRCASEARVAAKDTTLILGRLVDINGIPIARASYTIEAGRPTFGSTQAWKAIREGGRTTSDGLFQACTSEVFASAPRIRVFGRLPDGEQYRHEVMLPVERLTIVRIVIPRAVRQ